MDLASRRVVGYHLSDHDFTTQESIHIFEKALFLEALVKPSIPVKYVHTDSAGIFLSKDWQQFLEVNEILPSSADSKTMQNQVSERFNRTFKTLLRDKLNKKLNKPNNKTNTFQLIGEATKYNFENLKTVTEEVIVYYNTKRPHIHLNLLTPDSWAFEARRFPDHTYILKEKKQLDNQIVKSDSNKSESFLDQKQQDTNHLTNFLERYDIVPFVPLSKNDNSQKAKQIREFLKNIGVLNLREAVLEKRIDFSKLDNRTQNQFQEISKKNQDWELEIKYLETIMLQNQVLLSNIEELKEKTDELKHQNEELLVMNILFDIKA